MNYITFEKDLKNSRNLKNQAVQAIVEGGMDAWQTSVEIRLSSLDDKVGKICEGISRIEIKLASLPDKWFIIGTIVALFVLVIAAATFGFDLKPHK
ncbi:MAG: hypothetical protein KAS59_09950 [Alphaproteobacteria bacterium]|nr:hypothetical protein [Alphaproteobacteria bacterium]